MRILIVEDERRLANALCQILMEKKYMVDAVFDGRNGLEYAKSGIYDLIVLDVMLPSMDGFSVVSELRNLQVRTPVLMLTAKDSVSDKVKGLDAGADDYMTKPFPLVSFCRLVPVVALPPRPPTLSKEQNIISLLELWLRANLTRSSQNRKTTNRDCRRKK